MPTVNDILHCLEEFAPYELAESWDNCGLMTGERGQKIDRILCALDATEDVIAEAIRRQAQLVVAHHPLIFTSVRCVTGDDMTGRALRQAICNNISVICMHTNADCAQGGVNDALARALKLHHVVNMEAGENRMLGRVGDLSDPMSPKIFAAYVKNALGAGGVRYTDGGRMIRRVAVGGGACGKMMDAAIAKGADAFVIGDCSYDIMQRAQALGLTLVDAGHYPTENPIAYAFAEHLSHSFPTVCAMVSEDHKDCIQFV